MCARYKSPESEDGAEYTALGQRLPRTQARPRPRIQPPLPERRLPSAAERQEPADDWEQEAELPEEEPWGGSSTFRRAMSPPRRRPRRLAEPLPLREAPTGAFAGDEDGEEESEGEEPAFGGGMEPPPRPPVYPAAAEEPGSWRDYGRHLVAEDNPIRDFSRPPKKGMTLWQGIWLLISLPFRLIAFLTRALPKLILWPLRLLLSLCFVGGLLAICMAIFYGIKADRYDITQVQRMPERSIVLDRKGNEIGTLHGENRRSIQNLHEEVPQYFIDALVMQEDRSFWKHGGIDPRGLLRAVGQVFKHHRTTQGASTLTMQLAKNTYNHHTRNMDAKLTEMALARRIEATYDKETILNCYINRIFWGHTFMGLKQAARGYFNKSPKELTLGEAAMLAGIICSPNEFSPYRNLSAARVQRDKVLTLLFEHGYITRNRYDAALAEKLQTNKPEPRGTDNYALDLVRSEVDHILTILESQDRGIKEETIYSGGLKVRTTLDVDLQDDVMNEMDARLVSMFEKQKRYPHQTRAQFRALRDKLPPEEGAKLQPKYIQAACVIIDNGSGALLAVVGGRDSEESPLNRAVQCRRQVGSIFKPIVYGTFFERGGSPNALLSDDRLRPGEIKGAKNWNPGNSDGRFSGLHPAAWGLLKSRNTMSVRAGNYAGLSHVVSTALMAGFPRPSRPPGPTIYLGTWEASPLEVAGAFTGFANGGVRPTPYIIESITDASGHVIWQNHGEMRRVFSRRCAVAVSGILQQITKPGGTAGSMQKLGFTAPCGGKTGTTNGYKNAWFCGFTSDLTAAVWVGFDRPVKIAEKAYGGTTALPLWVGAMKCAAARGYQMKEIRSSAAAGQRAGIRLCRDSGMLAHSGCDVAGKSYTETLADLSKPRRLCNVHQPVQVESKSPDGDTSLPDDEEAEDPDETPDIDDVAEEVD